MSEIEWNQVIYVDCMNEENGLPTLPDKSVDLGFTDIPFNVNLNTNKIVKKRWVNLNKDTIKYKDNIKDYPKFMKTVFYELKRICNGFIIYCGGVNLSMFCNIEKPRQIIYRRATNCFSNGSLTYRRTIFPMVCYGEFQNRLNNDFFDYYSKSGFVREDNNIIHPCPLNDDFILDILSQLKPLSVLDPFLGSGTTAEVCIKLGIKWLGYEINEVYSQDINKRLKNCKKEPQQISLEDFNRI